MRRALKLVRESGFQKNFSTNNSKALILSSEKSFAEQRGDAKPRWTTEPVPSGSTSASEPYPGIPPGSRIVPVGASSVSSYATSSSPPVRVTTLSSGLRVATQDCRGQVSTFALFADAGSMYEAADEQGSCHFIETTAFKSSAGRSSAEVLAYQQAQGITSSAVFNREVVMFKAEVLRMRGESAISLLADAATNANWTDDEMNEAKDVIRFQREEALSQPQLLVSEHLYQAAYGEGTPLGRPEKCNEESAEKVTKETLLQYRSKYFVAPRMVLSAVNVEHDAVVKAAEKFLSHVPRVGAYGVTNARAPPSPYVGGDVRSSPDWSSVPATAAATQAASKTKFTHLMLGLPTVGWSHDDLVPVCVVDTLLGGGSSFSAGGPGKGMYSRLYREVLNANAWVESANAFSAQLYDCGLMGIYGAAPPDFAGELTSILAGHMVRLCEQHVRSEELKRSANQLASSVLMNLETRGLLAEDVGRQILCHGKRLDPSALVKRIKAVTPDDIVRVMRQALSSPPSYAAVGDVSSIAEYDAVRELFERSSQRWRIVPGSTFSNSGGFAKERGRIL